MREQMLAEGYICEGGNWISPYTGNVTSFQPAREEFMIVQQLGKLVHNSPMNWIREIKALKARNKHLVECRKKENRQFSNLLAVAEAAREVLRQGRVDSDDTRETTCHKAMDRLRCDLAVLNTPDEPEPPKPIRQNPVEFHFPWEEEFIQPIDP